MTATRLGRVVLSLLLSAVPGSALAQDGEALELLQGMVQANRQMDYRGIFTYEHAGVLRTVRVTHVVADGIAHEQLLYLDGPRREILRRGNETCPATAGGTLPAVAGKLSRERLDADLEEHYDIHIRGEGRIADRPVKVVQMVPRDQFRYGHVFAVDSESGLLLQSLLVGDNRRVLERFQFVQVEPLSAMEKKAALDRLRGEPSCKTEGASAKPESHQWSLAWVPPGFERRSHHSLPDGLQTQMYSDGLAVFTVFLDPEGGDLPEIRAQRGATVAQIARVKNGRGPYAVSVVGEVPAATADRVASFITFESP